jgi:uncharacterized protein YuzE
MITAIEIENFKGIGERVRVPLKPITLLFGANSSGKSSIIQALHYAREIFERGNFNASSWSSPFTCTISDRRIAMRITYDREVDALYIRFKETTVTTKHLGEGIAADYDADGRLAGIEILDAKKRLGDPAVFRQIGLEDIALASPS